MLFSFSRADLYEELNLFEQWIIETEEQLLKLNCIPSEEISLDHFRWQLGQLTVGCRRPVTVLSSRHRSSRNCKTRSNREIVASRR